MEPVRPRLTDAQLDRELAGRGLRRTEQRREVYAILARELDHPTAQDVYLLAKRRLPEISLATVYNCLEALVSCGLARRVQVDPAAGRYCPNMSEHGHFYCERCGSIFDVKVDTRRLGGSASLPKGFRATGFDVSMRGLCSACGNGVGAKGSAEFSI
jgi:Fur family peroxide stress response transcriptional regulator